MSPFWTKHIRRTRRVLGVLNYMGTTREPYTEPNGPLLKSLPRWLEIRPWADRDRHLKFVFGGSGGHFFHIDFGTPFLKYFQNVEDYWLPFGFIFASIFYTLFGPGFRSHLSIACVDFSNHESLKTMVLLRENDDLRKTT